jgi:hypothetical protein
MKNDNDLLITNASEALSSLMGLMDSKYWAWSALWNAMQPLSRDASLVEYLLAHGWARSPFNRDMILESQLYEIMSLVNRSPEPRTPVVHEGYLYRIDQDGRPPVPVILAISEGALAGRQIKHKPQDPINYIPLVSPFPPPEIGEYACVLVTDGKNDHIVGYEISQLPEEAQQRHAQLGEALRTLAGPLGWPQYTIHHMLINNRTIYIEQERYLAERRMLTQDEVEAEDLTDQTLQLHTAHLERDLLENLIKTDWQSGWLEVQRLIRDLARDYQAFHESNAIQKQEKAMSVYPLPPLTSVHHSMLPSADHFRGLAQSFGPRVALSLWNTAESAEQLLEAPNGARLAVRGENSQEKKALYELIEGGMGVEGIKYMIAMMAIYNEQTNAIDRKTDARVTLRQILSYMGRGDHADDLDEQRKVMHYILYLARTWVTALDKPQQVVKKRGRPPRIHVEYTPLIVLEALGSDERGGIKIPESVEFHLGKEFWDQMFATQKHFFTLPTALILNYHSKDQPQEICLSVYLANMLNLNDGTFAIHFPILLLQTGLQDQQDIDVGEHRTRAAMRVLYALERLELDLLITREAHPDIDMALAVEYFESKLAKNKLSERTLARIEQFYGYVQALSAAARRSHKRLALQNLLERVTGNSIKFRSGPLINTQIQKRIAGRQAAIESRERAQEAEQRRTRKRRKLQ